MSRCARARHEDERDLLDRAAEWPADPCWTDLTEHALRQMTREHGVDFATALLFDRLRRSREHGWFIRHMKHLRQRSVDSRFASDVLVAIAPGAFYVEHPYTGADGQAVRQAADAVGCRTELIPVASIGTPTANGRIICDWLCKCPARTIILLSLSKGGADVKMALAEPHAAQAFDNVRAWLNVAGIVDGSPMVTWGLARPIRKWLVRSLFQVRGRDFRFIEELRHCGGPLDFELRTPKHLKMIHIAGFPLRRHLSNRLARRWHRRLAPLGPNDSVTMLGDVCRLPGLVLPVWGADHYLQSRWGVQQLVAALLQYLGDELSLFQTAESRSRLPSGTLPSESPTRLTDVAPSNSTLRAGGAR